MHIYTHSAHVTRRGAEGENNYSTNINQNRLTRIITDVDGSCRISTADFILISKINTLQHRI